MSDSGTTDMGGAAAQDVRTALARVVASEEFRASPQLVQFLTYIVERTLSGRAHEIKGYTIAVEALGRDPSFDPQIDPIVRVEATRLRRAIDRYYATAGAREPLRIVVPRGTYVPEFQPAPPTGMAAPPLAPDAAPVPPPDPAETAGRTADAGPGIPAAAAARHWRLLPALAVGLAALALSVALWSSPPLRRLAGLEGADVTPHAADRFAPLVHVATFEVEGETEAGAPPVNARGLQLRLRDALSRFDDVRVASDSAAGEDNPAARADFVLHARIRRTADGAFSVSVWLDDRAAGTVAWSQTFDALRPAAREANEEAVSRRVATVVAQPYGIVHARMLQRRLAAGGAHGMSFCIGDSHEYWRSYSPALHRAAVECLEAAIEADASFALGHAALAQLFLEEHRAGVNPRPGPPLDRAMAAARRAVELAPASARAQQALLDVHFVRREFEPALVAGARALELNPYDTDILADYGARLIAMGLVDRGRMLVEEAAELNPGTPPWYHVFLSLAAYLRGDLATATYQAGLIRAETFPLGLAVRAAAAQQSGQTDTARQLVGRLVAIQPEWRRDPRGVLARFFPYQRLVDKLDADLRAAGLATGP